MLAWAAFGEQWAVCPKVNFDGISETITVPADLPSLDIKTDVYDSWLLWKNLYNYGEYDIAIRKVQDFYFLQNGWQFLPNQLHAANISGYLLPGEVIAAVRGEGGLAAWNVQPGTAPLF